MTMHDSPRVLISGAGIAGLALALQLTRHGVPTTVVERAQAPRPGGQAVDLRGASREVAERMGLMAGIEPRRLHEKGLAYVDGRGRVFGRMSMESFDGNGAVAEIEIARGDLAEVLRGELTAAAAAAPGLLDLRFGDRIIALADADADADADAHDGADAHADADANANANANAADADADAHADAAHGVDVTFEHGAPARFGVVVGADGVHSATRRLAFGPEEEFVTGLGGYAAFFTMPTPADIEPGWFAMRFVPGATLGIRPDLDPATAKAMLTLRVDRDPALRGDRARQQALISGLLRDAGWHAPEVIAAMDAASDFYFDELLRVDMPSVVKGRVVLLGDAASCGSPMTGMGTATALIGAYLLAERITGSEGNVAAALRAYDADIAPFAEIGKKIPGGGIARMVPASRAAAAMSRAMTGLMLSRPLRPLVRRMFAAGAEGPALPVGLTADVAAGDVRVAR
ncbi:FAD-binding monooxygenase [Microbacterium protaetiae]|uniref:FAD-binding monooxygenase n=1 Tax=Microbacterium protaetiae TaxID=2509458 RepID=A0A4P6EER9_9MICO|nr:FAD-dependent monooxygenase [Microbacterium protaetiae]QAY59883.1 FAD-binding monooxygenase [Microbacterium protaetiae]